MADMLIDRLTADLAPARPRKPWLEFAALLALAGAEAGAIVALGFARGDLGPHMGSMFWWKLVAPAVLALVAAAMAVRAGDPSRATPRAIGPVLMAMGVVLLGVVLAWTVPVGDYALGGGMACVLVAAVFASPPALALGLILRRAAPADPGRAAVLAAIAGGATGTALLALHCPNDGAVHALLWHSVAVALPAALAALPLVRWVRW